MKDRYLFKAKRLDNGEWVQGNILLDIEKNKPSETYRIYPVDHVDICRIVDETTICQCTGLKDKNGKLIWENDILHNGNYFVVKWNAPCARFDILLNNSHNIPIGKWEPMICDWKNNDIKEYRKSVDYEVIGNILDNPELLESEEK